MNKIIGTLAQDLFRQRYQTLRPNLCRGSAEEFLDELLPILIPALGNCQFKSADELAIALNGLMARFTRILACIFPEMTSPDTLQGVSENWFGSFAGIERTLDQDAAYMAASDPAALSVEEIMLAYPGFYAIAVFRLAHELAALNVPLLPRLFTEIAHSRTGIDIHPAAVIGAPFFIDHGTGVVIGETTTIGKRVKIYQGVTLGALSVRKDKAKTKRHPTIEDDCILYSNATVLGGDTVIGAGSIVGGSVWQTDSLPKGSRVSIKP